MPDLKRLAQSIIDKWSRQIYNIKSEYDPDGNFDSLYRTYQKNLLQQKEEKIK